MNKELKITIREGGFGYRGSNGTLQILKGLNLDFYQGDFIGVVGLNGVGKSTFLKSLCGLLPVLEGSVLFDGKDIKNLSLAELAKKIAIVLTEKISGFNLTAYDVVAAGQMPYTNAFNQLKSEHLAIIESAIEASGIKEYAYKPVNELSDGLFQKTVIAKALAQKTSALLLDEPTAFLDYASKHELFILLKNLAEKQEKCVLVSSHDLDLILKYCNRVLIISKDSIHLLSAEEAKLNEAFLRIGGGFI